MRNVLLSVLFGVVLLVPSGCEFSTSVGKSVPVIAAVSESVVDSEPVIAALEDVTHKTIPLGVIELGEEYAPTVGTGLKLAAGVAGAVPGGQPYAAILLGLSTLAGAAGTFFSNRKASAQKLALKTVVKAVDSVPLIGAKIMAVSVDDNTSIEVKAAYDEVKGA